MSAINTTTSTCPNCGGSAHIQVGQNARDGQLWWYESVRCAKCGNTEADGIGFPPAEIRRRILADEGNWQVVISEPRSVSSIAKVVRKLLDLDIEATAKLIKKLPGVAFEGTKIESKWVGDHIAASGEFVQIERQAGSNRQDR